MEENRKMKVIFISHAHVDKEYVLAFIRLLEDLGIEEDKIICSSIPPYCIEFGKNIYKWLAEKFQNYELHVIYLLSKNYYKSPDCLNEMGAAWVTKQKWDAILLPGFGFEEIKGCIDAKQIEIGLSDLMKERYNVESRLTELKIKLTDEFALPRMSETKWERKRKDFLDKIEELSQQISTNKSENLSEIINTGQLLVCKGANVSGIDTDYLQYRSNNSENGYIVTFNSKPFGKEKEYPDFLSFVYKYMDYVDLWSYVQSHSDARLSFRLINVSNSLNSVQIEFKHSGTEIFYKKEFLLQPGDNEITIHFSECKYKVLKNFSELSFVLIPASYKQDSGEFEVKNVRIE